MRKQGLTPARPFPDYGICWCWWERSVCRVTQKSPTLCREGHSASQTDCNLQLQLHQQKAKHGKTCRCFQWARWQSNTTKSSRLEMNLKIGTSQGAIFVQQLSCSFNDTMHGSCVHIQDVYIIYLLLIYCFVWHWQKLKKLQTSA